jgi:farnesyl-diphosphate farnesyltransferase
MSIALLRGTMIGGVTQGLSSGSAAPIEALDDDSFQDHLLQGVSRTFALTIPRLPVALARPVSNAYLLCRIVDTIEDEAVLNSTLKTKYCDQFVQVVRGTAAAADLRDELAPLLSEATSAKEHELIGVLPRVIRITHGFDVPQRDALAECVEVMARGMAEFQNRDLRFGLADLGEMNAYCYYVAGVVGEMLTKLFCHYSPEIALSRDELMALATSFGQGLQMTNILKDLWDDHDRGVCWLPRDVFEMAGFDLKELRAGHRSPEFRRGLRQLIAVARDHLRNALRYTLLLPPHETGLREFCLWALGMAVLTLRKINGNPGFSASAEVKISRRAVKATIAACRLLRSHNVGLSAAFALVSSGLPKTGISAPAKQNVIQG